MIASTAIIVGVLLCPGCITLDADVDKSIDARQEGTDTAHAVTDGSVANSMKLAVPQPLGFNQDYIRAQRSRPVSVGVGYFPEESVNTFAEAPPIQRARERLVNWNGVATRSGVYAATDFALRSDTSDNPVGTVSWTSGPALSAVNADLAHQRLIEPYREKTFDISAEFTFAAPREQTGLAVDLGFAPRASLREEGDVSVRSLGGEIRLGQNFDQRGQYSGTKSWYVFAGADGEALIWETGATGLGFGLVSTNALKLRDRITVGDIQAGVSVERFGGQFSLSYIRREVEYRDNTVRVSESENFAGLSITFRQ